MVWQDEMYSLSCRDEMSSIEQRENEAQCG